MLLMLKIYGEREVRERLEDCFISIVFKFLTPDKVHKSTSMMLCFHCDVREKKAKNFSC